MRREMQEVVPGVFLGPYFVASSSADALLQAGVTHVVCIRDPREAHIVRPYHPDRFCYLEVRRALPREECCAFSHVHYV